MGLVVDWLFGCIGVILACGLVAVAIISVLAIVVGYIRWIYDHWE